MKVGKWVVVVACVATLCSVDTVKNAFAGGYWEPWVTKLTTDSATINWRGDNNVSGSVEYATSSYYNEHQEI